MVFCHRGRGRGCVSIKKREKRGKAADIFVVLRLRIYKRRREMTPSFHEKLGTLWKDVKAVGRVEI